MNLQQFQALRAGDKIVNSMPGLGKSEGEVVVSEPRGVRVRWGEAAPNAPTFWYDVNGTAWFHWDKVEVEARCPTGPVCPHPQQCKLGTQDPQCLGGDYDVMAGLKPYPKAQP